MSLRGRSTLALAVCLLGCDPIYSVSGRVRSVPRGMPVTAAEPLPNAEIAHVCGDWRSVLDTTNSDGNFVGGGFGWWDERCALEISTPDGRHEAVSATLGELCWENRKSSCRNVALEWNVALLRRDADQLRERVEVTIESRTPNTRFYVAGRALEELCAPPCTVSMFVGDHSFGIGPTPDRAVRVPEVTIRENSRIVAEFHEDRDKQTIARVLIAVGGVAWLSSLFTAFVLENEPATIVTGAVGLSLILPGATLSEAGRARGAIKVSP
jgi:hypothetical protein